MNHHVKPSATSRASKRSAMESSIQNSAPKAKAIALTRPPMQAALIALAALAFAFLAFSTHAFAADKAVIQQMKGRRAIIMFEKDIPFSVGQKIFISSADGSELGITKDSRNPLERKNLVSLSSTIATVSTKPKSTTTIAVSARYGWNKENYEFGPIAYVQQQKTGAAESTTMYFGGFFDYNVIPNKPGEDFIWGAFGEVTAGNKKATKEQTLMTTQGGAFAKWFIFSPMLAVRVDAFFGQEKEGSVSSGKMGFNLGLNHYF